MLYGAVAPKDTPETTQLYFRGAELLDSHHYQEALELLQEAAHSAMLSAPKLALKALSRAARCARSLEDWPSLEAIARRMMIAGPLDEPEAVQALQEAIQAQGLGEVQTRLAKAQQAAVEERMALLYDAAGASQKRGRRREALDAYMQAVGLARPGAADRLAAKAARRGFECARALEAWPELQVLAEALIQAFPDEPDGPEALRESLAAQGRADEADQAIQSAREQGAQARAAAEPKETSESTALYYRGAELLDARNYPEALEVLMKAAQSNLLSAPSLAFKALSRAARCARALEDWPRLEAIARQMMIARDPADQEAVDAFEEASAAQGLAEDPMRLAKAKQRAIETRMGLLYDAAGGLQKRGRMRQALDAYKQVVGLARPGALERMSAKAARRGFDCARAIESWPELQELAEALIRAFPDETDGPEALREALAAQGRADDADAALEQARQQAVQARADVLFEQACDLMTRGRRRDALTMFQEVLEILPAPLVQAPIETALLSAYECALRLDDVDAAGVIDVRFAALAETRHGEDRFRAQDALLDLVESFASTAGRGASVATLSGAIAAAEAREDWARLEQLALRMVLASPERADGYEALTQALIQSGRDDEIDLMRRRARQAAAKLRVDEIHARIATLKKHRRKAEALEACFEMLTMIEPGEDDPRELKALQNGFELARGLRRWPELEKLALRMIRTLPDAPEGPETLAEALSAQDRSAETGEAVARSQAEARKARAEALIEQGRSLQERVRDVEAIEAFLEAAEGLSSAPSDERITRALAGASASALRLGEAEAIARVAERLDGRAAALDEQGLRAEAHAARIRAQDIRTACDAPQLTILTVVLEEHYRFVRQQLELIETLNPGAPFKLLVVDNSSTGEPAYQAHDRRCEVIAGVELDPSWPEHGRGSYHHAAALNMALKRVDTPYLLVLDPDFFVVYRNWIAEILDHMRRRSLMLFGCPWHYSWNRKWRYFPCVHFLMIDRTRTPPEALDFTPDLERDAEVRQTPMFKLLSQRAPILRNRMLLETRRDTGWKLFDRYRGTEAADVTLPVVDTRNEFRTPARLARPFGRWLEHRLPRRLRFLPAPGTYVEAELASAFGRPSIRLLSPEKFVWRGAPFAIHLRGQMREDLRTSANPQYKERAATQDVLKAVARSGPWPEWAFGDSGSD